MPNFASNIKQTWEINQLLLPWNRQENHRFPDDFNEDEINLINFLNPLNIKDRKILQLPGRKVQPETIKQPK